MPACVGSFPLEGAEEDAGRLGASHGDGILRGEGGRGIGRAGDEEMRNCVDAELGGELFVRCESDGCAGGICGQGAGRGQLPPNARKEGGVVDVLAIGEVSAEQPVEQVRGETEGEGLLQHLVRAGGVCRHRSVKVELQSCGRGAFCNGAMHRARLPF